MSTTRKNVRKKGSAWTSTEAATATQDLRDVRFTVASELEAAGELPGAFHLPPPEEAAPTRVYPGAPLNATTDIELGVKWGVSDYEEFMADEYSRRVTRGGARTLRDGQPVVVGGGTYRGHRGTCERPVAVSIPAPERADEARLERADGSADEVAQAGQDLASELDEAGGSADVVAQAEERASESDEEDARRVCAELEAATPADEWKVAVRGPSTVTVAREAIAATSRYFPSWFDLSEVEDQLGPLPVEWFISNNSVPVLPDL
ncbi:hypothetical protein L226DRAFT_467979, partial [Lentinus tigrinus ALCF2SS1-7]